MVMLTPQHIRAARAVLGWGVRELASRAEVSVSAITRLEAGRDVRMSTLDKIKSVIEAAGVHFEESPRLGVWWEP